MPVPRFGTKRVEMEYQHPVAVERYKSEFVVPLKPDVYGMQTAGFLSIQFELRSAHAIQDFEAISKQYPLQIREQTPNLVKADFHAYNVQLKEDFTVRYALDSLQVDTLHVITQRETASGPGFFQAQALLKIPGAGADDKQRPAAPRTLILLVRQLAFHAVGQAGAQLRDLRGGAAPLAGRRFVQPDVVQL